MGMQIRELEIPSARPRKLSNLFFTTSKPRGWLGVILPGLNYSQDMPLLYYTRMLLLHHQADVLNLMPATSSSEYKAADHEGRYAWLRADIAAGLDAGLSQGNYRGIILTGKSIGSIGLAVGLPLARSCLPTRAVWITPLLREAVVLQAALADESPALFLCGSGDSTFDPAALNRIQEKRPQARAWIGKGGDHSLEVGSDPVHSIDLLQEYLAAMDAFLTDEML